MYRLLCVSKQCVHSERIKQQNFDKEQNEIAVQVEAIKAEHPGCGVEKLYYTLQPKLLGRDKFCEIFLGLGYGVKNLKNYTKTTIPSHISYPNLIEGMQVIRPYQVIQSDITYFDLNGKFYYITFITDVYTREIVSHKVSDNLRAEANLNALNKALKKMTFSKDELIHHSDRGSQYGSDMYRKRLTEKGIKISMGLIAQDNAYAERVNGIIKNEYIKRWVIKTEKDLIAKVNKAVKHYNEKRKHLAFKNKYSPIEFKNTLLDLNTTKRPKVIIYAEGNSKLKRTSSSLEFNHKEEPQAHNCPIEIEINY